MPPRNAATKRNGRAVERFVAFRRLFEPYVRALSSRFEMPLPPLGPGDGEELDERQSSAWTPPG